MIKTKQEIRERIDKITENNHHILDSGMATIDVNAPKALMQLVATAALDELYWTLGERRPTFKCDDNKTINQ